MRNQLILCIIVVLLLFSQVLFGDMEQKVFRVSGRIEIEESGLVYIYLVDEETWKVPLTGFMCIKIEPDICNGGSISFEFNTVPEGEYGIRCFQDLNDNGELDKGLFGPKEPWGFSFKNIKQSGIPRFSDYSFYVDKDYSNIEIQLK